MKRMVPVQIDWKPDRERKEPVYRQIVTYICNKVSKGEWPIGTRLPSQRALAEAFGVNRSTIVTALDELSSYGILWGCHGAGTQIISNTWSLLLNRAPDWGEYVNSGFFRENNETIRKINHLAFESDLMRLGTGELDPRLFPKEMWQNVVGRMSSRVDSLGYLEPLGLMELRLEISRYMEKFGVHVPPSCILITSGSLQALQLISVCMLEQGSVIYTEAPTYLKSLQVFQSAGMHLTGIPLDEEGIQFWKLDELAGKRGKSPILYTIPTNHNPTGITMTEKRRRDFMDFCMERRLPIIEDGAYQELCFDQETPNLLKSMDQNGMVIYLGTVSKSLAPGFRVGWIVASEPIVQRLGDVKMQVDYGASSISQWILYEFFSSGFYEEYVDELKNTLRDRKNRAMKTLEKYMADIADWNHPTGGFYIWLTFRRPISMERLFEKAAGEKILLNPGDIYDFKNNNSLRLSYSYVSAEEFEEGVRKLARICREIS